MPVSRRLQRAVRAIGGYTGGSSRLARPPAPELEIDVRPSPGECVVGIDFITIGPRSGSPPFFEAHPSTQGAVEFWREGGGEPANWRATPHGGESRFSEVEFPDTYAAHADGQVAGYGALEEISGDPVIYHARWIDASDEGRVWRFNPVGGTASAVTATFSDVDDPAVLEDVAVRDYAPTGIVLAQRASTGDYQLREWTRASEGTGHATSNYWDFLTEEHPLTCDLEVAPGYVWLAGDYDATDSWISRIDELGDQTTWTSFPTITDFDWGGPIHSIQTVGPAQALCAVFSNAFYNFENYTAIIRIRASDAVPVDITGGCTVDGASYRSWADANSDGIEPAGDFHILGERVVAVTINGDILIGRLRRGPCPA